MMVTFYIAAAVAVIATVLAITRLEPVHGLLYLVVSLLAVAVVFFVLGAPFAAALEVIIYAGAILVVFVFVVMLLNAGKEGLEKEWLRPRQWIGAGVFAAILLAEMVYLLTRETAIQAEGAAIAPVDVGLALYGPYLLAVELASLLLMAGLVGAHHLGRRNVQGSAAAQPERQVEEKR